LHTVLVRDSVTVLVSVASFGSAATLTAVVLPGDLVLGFIWAKDLFRCPPIVTITVTGDDDGVFWVTIERTNLMGVGCSIV
jgi:hypothetical protein